MLALIIILVSLMQVFTHSSEEEHTPLIMSNSEAQNEDSHYKAFGQSFASIFVSEIGDRTFFVAAVMAMRYNKKAVFVGSAGALVLMTFISCVFGYIVPQLIPKTYTEFIAMILFFFFGIKLLYEWKYGVEVHDEKNEVEEEMKELHKKLVSAASNEHGLDTEKVEDQIIGTNAKKAQMIPIQNIIWQAFILTFLGEWGDRSQFATIALAAVHHAWIVFIGGSLGHILCTIIAILGGEMVSEKITEKTVNLVGGVVFTLFGIIQGIQLLVQLNHK